MSNDTQETAVSTGDTSSEAPLPNAESETALTEPTSATPAEPAASSDASSAAASSDAVSSEPASSAEATSSEPAAAAGESHDEGDEGDDDSDGEGAAEGEGASATEGAAVNADGTAPVKKKRRRRRKKKPGGAPGVVLGPDGVPVEGGQAAADGAPPAEGESATNEDGSPNEERRQKRQQPNRDREPLPFRVGEEVFGRVERVTDHAIWVDVAGKALGLFDRRELGEGEPPTEGDQFIATVASHGVRGGMLRMSRAPLMVEDAKKKVEAASASGEPVEGFVTGAVRGGLEVDIDGLRAFAPASHVELRPGADLAPLVGQRMNFIVVQYEKKGRDVVVSRKKFLAEEAQKSRDEALSSLEPGSIHKGIVRTVVQWGAFVALPDAGGIEGLIHASEASHDRSVKLADLFKPGDHVEVKVLRVDEKKKLWLSRKSITNDPWDAVKEKYAVGTRHTGKIVRIQPFGVFVELEPGIDGLCYTADLSFKQVANPNEIVKIDEPIEVVVATCDGPTRRISLHAAPPADEASEPRPKVGPHRIVKVAIVQTTEAGLIVRLLGLSGRAARGFIPAGHTGTQRGTDLRKHFPVGTKLEAKVLEVDPRRGETKLSIRALREDTEKQAYQEYRATVAREAKFGTFADLLNKK